VSLSPGASSETFEPAYLRGLNDAQRQAVESIDGPVLVLAGAGVGKTRVLTSRIAHILATGRARENEILAVTFTNKAAREMRERLERMSGGAPAPPWLGTFHSLGVRVLRRYAERVGLTQSFTILDADDQLRLLKQILKDANVDEKRWPARMLAALIERWKNRAIEPGKAPAGEAAGFANGRGADFYQIYQNRLRTLNAVDFGDLLLEPFRLMRDDPDALAFCQRFSKYALVDEYQDTNAVQYLWLRLIAQKTRNLCCVGDDDQSIYSWRGADVENILRFEKDFPDAKIIRLERNYRSGAHILGLAATLIANNRSRLGKTLRAAADNPTAAIYMGIDVDRAHRVAFGIGAGITAIAGGLVATYHPFQPYVGFEFVIIMYAGVVMGGMGSILGAFWGGMTIGLVQQLATLVMPLQLQNAAIFAVFLLVVLLRPQGLFGRATERI